MHILRLVLLSLAAVVAMILGWSLLERASRPADKATPEIASVPAPSPDQAKEPPAEATAAARVAVQDKLSQAPDYQRFFDRLKLLFPTDYDAIVGNFAQRLLNGGDPPNVDLWMAEAVRTLRLSRGVLAAKADAPALGRIFEMQLAMMRALADKDARLCVDFLYGGASRAFYAFSSENRTLVADMAIAGLDAIADGQGRKTTRGGPNEADFQLLETALTGKGLVKAEIEAILDGKTSDPPIDDGRMCQIGQIYLETLATLPEPARTRIYGLAVELMARS